MFYCADFIRVKRLSELKRLTTARQYGNILCMKKKTFCGGRGGVSGEPLTSERAEYTESIEGAETAASVAENSEGVESPEARISAEKKARVKFLPRDFAKNIAEISLFCALMVVFTLFVSIPFYPVPLTFQTTICVLCGLILGTKKGSAAMGAYFFLGFVCHLPVFSGGIGGFSAALRPTFGYIIGFVVSAFVAGIIGGKKEASLKRCCVAALSGVIADYVLGVPYFLLVWNLYMGKPDVLHAAV